VANPARTAFSARTGRKPAIEPNKQKAIDICQSGPLWHSPAKHVDLLPQDQILRLQLGSRPNQRSQNAKNQPEQVGRQAEKLSSFVPASTPNPIFGTHRATVKPVDLLANVLRSLIVPFSNTEYHAV
jgi:hypothetical protein